MKKAASSILGILLLLVGFAAFAQDELASVEGRVTTLWGTPLKNVKVSFFQLEGISGISKTEILIRQITTDSEGRFRTDNLPWGQYRIDISSGYGKTEIWRYYLWRNAKRILDVGLPLENTLSDTLSQIMLSGVIQQTDQDHIADATVTLTSAFAPNKTQQARTDKNGHYQFKVIQPGQYILFATKPGFLADSLAIDLGNGERAFANLVLKQGKSKGPL